MNYNPYAPPQAAPPPPGGLNVYSSGPQPWEIGEVLTAAFEGLKVNWVVLVFTNLTSLFVAQIVQSITRIPSLLGIVRVNSVPDFGLQGCGVFLGIVVQAFFQVGLLRIALGVARGRQPEFGELFSGGDRFLPMLGAMMLMYLGVGFGFVLLIVPGVILLLGLSFTTLMVVDQGLAPVDALKASWNATDGQKAKLFAFGFVAFCIAMGSILVCCLPILAAIPTLAVANAIIYLRVTGRGAATPPGAPGGYNPGPGGGPGYGPPPGGGYGGPPGGGYGGPPGGGGYGPPGGGGYGPQGGGGGYGPQGGGGYGPQGGGGGGYGPQGGGGYGPQGGGGYGPQGGGGQPGY